ncbi:MAG TPA: hypothetical protein VGN05_01695 [Parvibaculum sp.]
MALAVAMLCHSANADEPVLPAGTASIRGDLVSGPLRSSTGSRIVAVDGRLIYGEVEPCKPVSLAVGLHSLVVDVDDKEFPLRLDAKPDTAYAVKWTNDSSPVALVENGNTKEIVARISTNLDDLPSPYAPPAGDTRNLATIKTSQLRQSNWPFGDADVGHIYVSAVDGQFVDGYQTQLSKRAGDHADLNIAPGARALMIGAHYSFVGINGGDSYGWINMPILFQAEPATTYVLKYGKIEGAPGRLRFDFWIEDETHGKTVYPKNTFFLNLAARGQSYMAAIPEHKEVSFPLEHGQVKRTPEKPKPWCEHD